MKPQVRGAFFKDGGSCALGAALDGSRATGKHVVKVPSEVNGIVMTLNDAFAWPREKIAAVLKSFGF